MATSNNWYQQVLADVKNANIQPPSTKAEAITYFQERYPKNWNAELSKRLQPLLPPTKSGQPQSIKNIERRHQARAGKGIPAMTTATAGQYKELGVLIGVKPPKHGYHIRYEGWVLFSNVCSYRTFDVDITGEWAAQVTAEPALVFPAMFLLYMEEDDQDRDIDEQEPSVGFCESGDKSDNGDEVKNPDIRVSANEKETHSGHSGQRRRF